MSAESLASGASHGSRLVDTMTVPSHVNIHSSLEERALTREWCIVRALAEHTSCMGVVRGQ